MQLKEIQTIKQKISDKIERGDYVTLSKVLEVKRETALSRYLRNNKEAVLIMKNIVTARDKLIKKLLRNKKLSQGN